MLRSVLLKSLLIFLILVSSICVSNAAARKDSRLLEEQSLYLRQHADNLVDWYPWGEEAFRRAREENKPIFLSIGYSTCHWCHVMERESFMDAATAEILNTHYINIKIDREERPDIDRIYMHFLQASTGSGGWPMSVWLTPDLKPFFGGTYFPLEGKYGRLGFKDLINKIATSWQENSAAVEQLANSIMDQLMVLSHQNHKEDESLLTVEVISAGVDQFAENFDARYGGFGDAPKFPRPSTLNFLHRAAMRAGKDSKIGKQSIAMASKTLKSMANGGMYDHLGGGFHRYSVDSLWHVPHFEKMLYDQAQLTIAYLDAYQITGDPTFAEVARDILRYVSRDMTAPAGGFYSAEDAESLFELGKSEHGEGAFYLWEQSEINTLLGQDAALFNFVYGVQPKGNMPGDLHQKFGNKNILIKQHNAVEAAKKFELSESVIIEKLNAAHERLFAVREERPRPKLDDKILTAWNGLMISAYARAYVVLDEPEYLLAATKAAVFLKNNLIHSERQSLLRSFREKPSEIDAFATDYALLIQGLLDLYSAGFDIEWLQWAETLQRTQDSLFWDEESGSYFASYEDDDSVIVRLKEFYDGAIPSENSVAALNLLRFSAIFNNEHWQLQAQRIFRNFASLMRDISTSVPQMLVALDFALQKPQQIVIAGKQHARDTRALMRIINAEFRPHSVVLLADGGRGQAYLGKYTEAYDAMIPRDGKATAYICESFVCELPTNDPEQVKALLK